MAVLTPRRHTIIDTILVVITALLVAGTRTDGSVSSLVLIRAYTVIIGVDTIVYGSAYNNSHRIVVIASGIIYRVYVLNNNIHLLHTLRTHHIYYEQNV